MTSPPPPDPRLSGLLIAVNAERRRHLTFDELEALVEHRDSQAVDALARKHLAGCLSCRRELDDLRSFVPLASREDTRMAAGSPPATSSWQARTLWIALAVAVAAALTYLFLSR